MCALVFGANGEGSPNVHHCIEASALQRARQTWRSLGARTEEEAYGYWVQQFTEGGDFLLADRVSECNIHPRSVKDVRDLGRR